MDDSTLHELFREIEIIKLLTEGYAIPLDELLKIVENADSMEQIGKKLNTIWNENGKRVVVEQSLFKDKAAQLEMNMVREAMGLKPYRQPSPGAGTMRRQMKKWLND